MMAVQMIRLPPGSEDELFNLRPPLGFDFLGLEPVPAFGEDGQFGEALRAGDGGDRGTSLAGRSGLPAVSTRWTPKPSCGQSRRAVCSSSSTPAMFIIAVVEVTIPSRWAWRIPAETVAVRP